MDNTEHTNRTYPDGEIPPSTTCFAARLALAENLIFSN